MGADDFICLVAEKAKQEGTSKPPVLSLQVVRWSGTPGAAELTLYECDYQDEKAPGKAEASAKREIAKLNVTLAESGAVAEPKPPQWKITDAKVVKGKGKAKIEAVKKGGKASKKAAFVLALDAEDKHRFSIEIAGEDYFHDEAGTYEIGLGLVQGSTTYERFDNVRTAQSVVPAPDPVRRMQALKSTEGKGRFSDTKRNPSVKPGDAPDKLDDTTLALLKGKSGPLPEGEAIDVDGLRFAHFIPVKDRRSRVPGLVSAVKLSPGDLTGEHKATDIEKAYFIIHDIGSDGVRGPLAKHPKWKPFKSNTDFRQRSGDRGTGTKTVNGYVNQDGTLALLFDQKDATKGGAVYQWQGPGSWLRKYCVGYETDPICETTPDDDDPYYSNGAGKYACVGWKEMHRKKFYFKWTHALVDGLADLYVCASARANNLLTLTTHNEIDKNHHDDPRGLDLQVLYDKITDRLNALGGLQLPKGVRYGINKKRSIDPARSDHGHPFYVSNSGGWAFPHQSGTFA